MRILNKKVFKASFILFVMFLIIALAGCGSDSEDPSEQISSDEVFTIDKLSKYDGKDGNPAYIAVDGVVYDVSNSSRWRNGEHNGYQAGNDLTDEIESISPHGTRVLNRMPVVGTLEN